MEEEEEVFSDAIETHSNMSSLKRPIDISPLSKVAQQNDQKRLKFLQELDQINVSLIMNDESIPDYAKLIINQLSGLLSAATDLIAKQPSPIEAIEEYQRQHEVVLINLKESEKAVPSEKIAEDRQKVVAMLDAAQIELSPNSVYRMGKAIGTKPRLVKIVMPTRRGANEFVKAANKIKQQFPEVRIRHSLSLAERQAHKSLVLECNQKRKDSGNDYVVYAGQVILRSDIKKKH